MTLRKTPPAATSRQDGNPDHAPWLSSAEQAMWRRWLNVHRRSNTELARQLSTESQLSLADYEVLVNLSEAPQHRKRIVSLADAIQWDRSRLSHQITRMARRGLVRRESCSADGRGAFVVLENEGLEAIQAAAAGHVRKVRELIFECLSSEDVEQLSAILEKLDAQFENHL